jgi:hypothetical protein
MAPGFFVSAAQDGVVFSLLFSSAGLHDCMARAPSGTAPIASELYFQ